jgi:hypothetical protein
MFSDCVNQRPLQREFIFVLALPFPFDYKQRHILASILFTILMFPLPKSISYFLFPAKSLPFDRTATKDIGSVHRQTTPAPMLLYYLFGSIIGEYSEIVATHQATPSYTTTWIFPNRPRRGRMAPYARTFIATALRL